MSVNFDDILAQKTPLAEGLSHLPVQNGIGLIFNANYTSGYLFQGFNLQKQVTSIEQDLKNRTFCNKTMQKHYDRISTNWYVVVVAPYYRMRIPREEKYQRIVEICPFPLYNDVD